MLESYHADGMPLPLPPLPPKQPLPAPARTSAHHYQLVALRAQAAGQQRTLLGLRRHLSMQETWRRQPAPGLHEADMTRPLVLRAALGEIIETEVTNLLPDSLCLALVDDDYKIFHPASTDPIPPGETRTCLWRCCHAGIYPIYNCASTNDMERRNLLGVLIIEP